MIYPIVIFGADVLRKPSVEIDADYPELKKLIDDMFLTLTEASGVGLAAPQIGILKRVVVIDIGEGPIVMINPKIVESSGEHA